MRGHVGEEVEGHGRERNVSAKRCMYRRRYVRTAPVYVPVHVHVHVSCALRLRTYVRTYIYMCVYVCEEVNAAAGRY